MTDTVEDPTRTALDRHCWYQYIPNWLDTPAADALLTSLTEESEWIQRAIVARGKEVMQPRLLDWYSDVPYKYSGQVLEPRQIPDHIAALNARASETCGEDFNHILLNLYRDGNDRIGMHADNEPELGWEPIIGSLSLGVSRKFLIQHRMKRSWRKKLQLEHGSLLVMGGAFQRRWRHGVPKQPSIEGARINVTFRRLMGPPGWRPEPQPWHNDKRG